MMELTTHTVRTAVCGLFLTCSLFAGCTERSLELRPEEGVLQIDLNWPSGAEVSAARVWLYDGTGSLYASEACTAEGWRGRVPAGTYSVLAANDDYTGTECLAEHSWTAARLVAQRETDGSISHVKRVYCIGARDIVVRRGGEKRVEMVLLRTDRWLQVRIDPRTRATADDLEAIQVRLTGAVPSVRMSDATDAGEEAMPIHCAAACGTDGVWTAMFTVFGWRSDVTFSLDALLSDGTTVSTEPLHIGDRIEKLPEEGGTVEFTTQTSDGRPIVVTVGIGGWISGGSGDGSVVE